MKTQASAKGECTQPRLLLVVNQLESFLNHRLPIALAAQKAGYDVHVAMSEADEARQQDSHGLTFHNLPLIRSFGNPVREIRSLRRLVGLIDDIRPDVVHAFTLKPSLTVGLVSHIRKRPLTVVSITGLGSFFAGTSATDRVVQSIAAILGRLALGAGNAQVVLQNEDDLALVGRRFGIPTDRMSLTKCSGVDLSAFAPQPEPDGPIRIVLAARMIADKGIREFVAAARLLREQSIEAKFVLAGGLDEENRSAVEADELTKWSNEEVVDWIGRVSDMAALYRGCHIACLPSRYREGVPKSLIEAAACGRPAVTTDMPGCRDIVVDETTGLIVPPNNVDALAKALARLIIDDDLRQKFGAAARKHVENGYSVEAVTGQVMALYETGRRAARPAS
ncbi:MAG: glycosyltransferase family 4 protein [Candidatus Phaeomarinobacter sp.]